MLKYLVSVLVLLAYSTMAVDDRLDAYLPKTNNVVKKKQFDLSFDADKHTARWVMYILDDTTLTHTYSRKGKGFHKDPRLPSTTPAAYVKSGYDQGHMCPAEDMEFDDGALTETFETSNVIPQSPHINRGVWKTIENEARAKAKAEHLIVVITGPIYVDKGNAPTLPDGTMIPSGMFKILYNPATKHVICHIVSNDDKMADAQGPAKLDVPLKDVEDMIGVKFPFDRLVK